MLSVAGEHLTSLNPDARLVMYGQELSHFKKSFIAMAKE